MTISFQRSIRPVGQGAFYTEHFEIGEQGINVVYDCGTLSKISGHSCKESIKNEIHRTFKKDEKIRYVFVSHFDADHSNGIVELCNYCDVEQLIIPLITELEWQLLLHGPDASVRGLLHWLESSDRRKPMVYVVSPIEEEKTSNRNYHEFQGGFFERVSASWEFPIQCDGHNNEPFWLYHPFNFSFEKRHMELLNELSLRGLDVNAISRGDPYTISKYKSEITASLDAISGSRNANSMCVLSTPKEKRNGFPTHWCGRSCYPGPLFDSSCLYTGDYEAGKGPHLQELLVRYAGFGSIGTLQIPHHGSYRNFNRGLIDQLSPALCFVSCGFQNKYQHPNGSVVRYILQKGIPFIIVNEYPGTAQYWNWTFPR